MERFVRKLEEYLGVEKTPINLAKTWQRDDPAGNGLLLGEYLQDVKLSFSL